MKKKKQKPNYQTDKYGLLYDTNKQLSENDREILKTLHEMVKNRTGTDDKQ